jgi:hypothetical protein
MNTNQTEVAIKAMMRALPLRSPSARFDSAVLAALGFAPKKAPWLLWAEELGVTLAVGWIGLLACVCVMFAVWHADSLACMATHPGQVLSLALFSALKLWHFAGICAVVLEGLLVPVLHGLFETRILVTLMAGTLLAGISITALAPARRPALN